MSTIHTTKNLASKRGIHLLSKKRKDGDLAFEERLLIQMFAMLDDHFISLMQASTRRYLVEERIDQKLKRPRVPIYQVIP